MGDSIIDVVADSVSLTGSGEGEDSLRDHMGNKQDYFTATKNFTQNPANAEHVKTLSDGDATFEQKEAAYTALVNEIADYMDVDPTEAKVLMSNDSLFAEVAGAHSRDTDTVYVNDAAHDNASDAVNTVGHETQHYLDNQQNPDAEQTETYHKNRDEYARIMGDATEDYLGFNFAQNDTSLADGNSHSFGTTADDVLTNLNLISENQKAYDSENQGSLDHNIFAAVPAAEAGLGLAALGIVAASGDEDAKRQFAQDVEQLFNDINGLMGGETNSPDTINTEYVVNELIALKVKEAALIEEGSDNYHAFNEIYEKRASLTQGLPADSRAGINDTVTAFVNDFNEGTLGNSGGFQAADEPAVIAMPNPVQDSPGTTVLDNTPPEIPGEAGGYEPGASLPSVEGSPVQDGHWSDHLVFNDTVQEADPNKIKFTQDSIKNSFKDGQSIEKLVEGLKSGEISAEKVPAIRVFEKNGETYSLDNRRLKAFQDAGVPIKTVPATAEEIANESYKFTSKTDGKSIRIRGGK
ncbi:hypothetical protein CWI84_06160 [Idiomarina tyrosinivorans]|uniref:Uncharacterized protein n=1 Tax=Idiomarina tyrosinivorans TaxID=1445662 RepID=A0A432ZQK4_9GAMM|nr:hypothetical protein [Idiomarina tyrosinivorans]RUO80215.1 hypothetical protein CWI84_06160 [Idiomarina tyrosinivorans]